MRSGKLHFGWYVAAVTFLVMLVGAGVRSTPGVLILPLESEFHWSRDAISFAIAVNLLMFGLAGPFTASMIDRIGLRRTMNIGLILLILGVFGTIFMTATWHLILLWGVVVGTASGIVAMVLGAEVAARWFASRQGLVLGLLTASSAMGQLVFLPVLALLLELYGWRAVCIGIVVTSAALIPLVVAFVRGSPEEMGLKPYGAGDGPTPARKKSLPAMPALWAGLKRRDFWLLGMVFFTCGASANGLIGTHLIAACADHGIGEVAAAGMLAGMGAFNFVGSTFFGWLSDRYDGRHLLAIIFVSRGLSLLALPFLFDGSVIGLSAFAIFYGFEWVATVPPTVKLIESSFGRENIGVYYGWITLVHQLGAALVAWMAGLIRVDWGDYQIAFLASGALCMLAAASAMAVGGKWRGGGRIAPANAVA